MLSGDDDDDDDNDDDDATNTLRLRHCETFYRHWNAIACMEMYDTVTNKHWNVKIVHMTDLTSTWPIERHWGPSGTVWYSPIDQVLINCHVIDISISVNE